MRFFNFKQEFDTPIRNIVFDLGGVIVNVDYLKTRDAFEKIGIGNFERIFSQFVQSNLADDFEVGAISPAEFRGGLRKMIDGVNLSDKQIDEAWNAMILDFPSERIKIFENLRTDYRIFMLSNTNKIHIDYCMKNIDFAKIANTFEKVYLSHEIHERKPNVAAYNYVLHDAGLLAAETLFIDDTLKNIDGAKEAGLQAYHLTNGETIEELFVF